MSLEIIFVVARYLLAFQNQGLTAPGMVI